MSKGSENCFSFSLEEKDLVCSFPSAVRQILYCTSLKSIFYICHMNSSICRFVCNGLIRNFTLFLHSFCLFLNFLNPFLFLGSWFTLLVLQPARMADVHKAIAAYFLIKSPSIVYYVTYLYLKSPPL